MVEQPKSALQDMMAEVEAPGAAHPAWATLSPSRYRRLLRDVMFTMSLVTILPLVIMTGLTYFHYRHSIRSESRYPITHLTSNSRRALEFFLLERESALRMIVNNELIGDPCSNEELTNILKALRKSLPVGSFVDLGVIDTDGIQKCYAGPYDLLGKDYKEQEWFERVRQQGIFISEVFLGYREFPHFVIAIRYRSRGGHDTILRATIDTERLHEQLLLVGLQPTIDLFVINREGVLQTPSRRYGTVLHKVPLPVPTVSARTEVVELEDRAGEELIAGYAYVRDSPFIVMHVSRLADVLGGWFGLRAVLLGFLGICSVMIFFVVLVISRNLVRNIRESDLARAQVFHKMQYTNKLASVGRLAAGVAHEINNPLAIINEKAGLLKDRLSVEENLPDKDKALKDIASILRSVDRCSTITHRLLGFAKHIDARRETIDLTSLLHDILGFLGSEAFYRDVNIEWKVQRGFPSIRSDRGQLQQVFLNIINNALAAVKDGGLIRITTEQIDANSVAVSVEDNGIGIPKDKLKRIFEPFFTINPGAGSGLGLSVTYGMVQKLGGDIRVESEYGKGTRFTVTLPIVAER